MKMQLENDEMAKGGIKNQGEGQSMGGYERGSLIFSLCIAQLCFLRHGNRTLNPRDTNRGLGPGVEWGWGEVSIPPLFTDILPLAHFCHLTSSHMAIDIYHFLHTWHIFDACTF